MIGHSISWLVLKLSELSLPDDINKELFALESYIFLKK
jgi:hypothetical protein